ncbi:MAG: hypothetical protein J2P58_16095, partial [Acidimicrobiaceae bacterium]|nr:hypothetical protein [Acidimicrobiaceae bacterium]
GWGGDALLDSYSQERQPVFWETGAAVIAGGIQRDNEFLQRYRPEHDLPEFEAAWAKRTTGDAAGPSYEPNYGGSPVVFGSEGASSGVAGSHTFAAQGGHHLAPAPLSSGRNVYEELGADFTLLSFDGDRAAVERFVSSANALGVPLTVVTDSREGDRAEFRAGLVLVRPDQFVAWAGDEEPPDLEALFRRVTGTAGAGVKEFAGHT